VGVAGDYFAAMGIPLRSGRFLKDSDGEGDKLTCIVDETFAHLYWPEGGAVGKQLYPGTGKLEDMKPYLIVGVVGAVKQAGLTERQGRGAVYFPYSRRFFRSYVLVARTSLPPDAVVSLLVRAVRDADPDVSLSDLRSMEVRINDSLLERRSPALMAAIFATAALLLATVGLYGVMAYAVAQRTREFGVRIALGAQDRDVLGMVFAEGVRLAAAGIAVGITMSLLITRYMSSLLFGVEPNNPTALAGVAALISVVACVASLLPARRATRVDPMVALRSE
jgi:predicted permease